MTYYVVNGREYESRDKALRYAQRCANKTGMPVTVWKRHVISAWDATVFAEKDKTNG